MRRSSFCLALVAVLILAAVPAYAGPIPIDILSQHYRIEGSYRHPPLDEHYLVFGTESVYSPHYPRDQSQASRSFADSQVFVKTLSDPGAEGQSLAEMVFRPRASGSADILVSAGGWPTTDSDYWVKLRDLSTGGWLMDLYETGDDLWYDWDMTFTRSFIEGHQYHLFVQVRNRNQNFVQATVTMPFTTAPDPGSTLLLLGMGVVGLAAWRKRRE